MEAKPVEGFGMEVEGIVELIRVRVKAKVKKVTKKMSQRR